MPVRMLTLLMTLVLLTLSMAYAADKDEVDERVEKAREAYQSEMELIREEVAKELDTKEAAERKRTNPDLEKIKTIKSDREELTADEKIPDSISTKIKSRINKNRTKFINVLTAAKNEFVRAKLDDEAEAIAQELEKFKSDGTLAKAKPAAAPSKPAPAKPLALAPTKPAPVAPAKPAPVIPDKPATAKQPVVVAKAWPKNAPPLAVLPFDAEQAKKHQQAWAKYLKIPVEYTNSIGMKFVLIPPGEFLMGSTPADIDEPLRAEPENKQIQGFIASELPQHKVILTNPIYLGVYEVTCEEYQQVMGTNPGPGGTNPVEKANWNDAAEFCAKLSEKEKLKPFYSRAGENVTRLEGTGYRLSTEAEWEFACRAGTTTRYSTGDDGNKLAEVAWYSDRAGRGQPVGRLKPNQFGLYDMHGNNWEWVDDTWEPTFYAQFENSVAVNPSNQSKASPSRVARGGDWVCYPLLCRSAKRHAFDLTSRYERVGFRIALVAVAAP